MSGPFNIAGNLMAAQAASYAKGQEVSAENGKEKAEQARALRRMLVQAKGVEMQKKANDTNKGILA